MSLTPNIVNGSHADVTIPLMDDREDIEKIVPNGIQRRQCVTEDDNPGLGKSFRRNSRSLPTGLNKLELEHLQRIAAIHEGGDSESITDGSVSVSMQLPEESNKSTFTTDDDDDEWDEICDRKTQNRFRNKRRASLAPLPALRLNNKIMDLDAQSIVSNQNSITSVNSIASLLREKMQALPHYVRRKKKESKDYKIKIFVIMLFFVIIFLISYAYVMYHKMILQKTYFDNAKFNEHSRIFRLFDFEGDEIIKAHLGKTFESGNEPFHCLSEDYLDDGSICLEWTNLGRLYMNFDNKNVFRCYTLKWQALGEGVFPTDCFELSRDGGLWFGGGLTKNADWNLNTANFSFAPFITGDSKVYQFGNALKRYFLNSRGVAIEVSDKTPFHLSIKQGTKQNGAYDNTLCIRAANDEFAFVNKLTPLPELEYKVCIAEDMRSLHNLMTQKSLWSGLSSDDYKRLEFMLEWPVWRIPNTADPTATDETLISKFSESVIDMSYMKIGHILINEFWQENIGDFTVDKTRFPNLTSTIDLLTRRGFKVIFTVQPFISTDSPNFKDAVKKKLLIYERFSERSIPALTRYKSSSSAGVLDITNNDSIPWLMEKLQTLKDEYKVDSFYFDMGTGYNLPHYYQCRKTLVNPDEYAKIFTSSFESLGIFGISAAASTPKPPTFVSLPPMNSTWDSLRTLVTSAVKSGILGYPFLMSGAVGGDYHFTRNTTKMMTFYSLDSPPLPSKELYIRWMQIAIFLPSMSFVHLPLDYQDPYVTDVMKDLMNTRQKTVIPVLKKFLKESLNNGLPLIRPMWMLDPYDYNCININDEFTIGDELLVAPIMEEGSESREVYLPAGVWQDGIDGTIRKGNIWLHQYKVPKEKIAYFVKMPNNTRF